MSKINSERLKLLRKENHYRQEDVAKAIGIGRTGYVRIENGERGADTVTLSRLADLFNVSVDYLLGRTEPPTDEEIKAVFPNGRMDFQLFGDKGQAVNQKYIDRALELFAQMSDEEKEKAIHQIEMVLAYSKMKENNKP